MIPNIDFNLQAINMLPEEQREPNFIIFSQAEVTPFRRMGDLLRMYIYGSEDTGYWSSGTTYAAGDLVRDVSGVYESQQDGNVGHAIGETAWWVKILPSFIGALERLKYNGRYLPLTWALNRHFGTTFRQPPYPSPYGGSGTYSDIYITTDAIVRNQFTMFPDAEDSSAMYPTLSSGAMYDPAVYALASTYKYTIHFPAAVFNALGANGDIRTATARRIIDKYNTAAINYSIDTY